MGNQWEFKEILRSNKKYILCPHPFIYLKPSKGLFWAFDLGTKHDTFSGTLGRRQRESKKIT